MGLFRTTDPVTGITFSNADWRLEASYRDRYTSFASGWLPDSEVVATDGGQGYETKTHARGTLEKVIGGHYDGPVKELD